MAFRLIRETFLFNIISTFFYVLWCIVLTLFSCFSTKEQLSIRGKCILVTGGSRGVGEELLGQFAKHKPAKIIVVSRSGTVLQTLCRRLNSDFEKTEFLYYSCDLGDNDQVVELTQSIKLKHGCPHIIVCNAGIVTSGRTIEEISDKEIEHTFNVNTLSHFTIMRNFLKNMAESGEECQIVLVLSLLSFFGLPRLSTYCSSKGASYLLSEALRSELSVQIKNVQITTIHPYLIDTSMFSSVKLKYPFLMSPLKSVCVAKEIVKATINRDSCVIIPKYMAILPSIKALVPIRVWHSIMQLGDPYTFAESLPNRL